MTISISRSAKILTNSDNYATATLKSVEVVETELDGKERSQLEFIFALPTTKGTTDKYLWTGLNVNSDKTYRPVDANGVAGEATYNKLTQLLLATGLISKELLLSGDDIDVDIEFLVGKEFQFKLVPQKNKPNFSEIDLTTLRLVESAAPTDRKVNIKIGSK